jgi:hypothetical protein
LSRELGINAKTVAKWRRRETVKDIKIGPTEPQSTVLTERHDLPRHAFYLAAICWVRLPGHIMLELFHFIQPVIMNVDTLFANQLKALIHQTGLKPTQ